MIARIFSNKTLIGNIFYVCKYLHTVGTAKETSTQEEAY